MAEIAFTISPSKALIPPPSRSSCRINLVCSVRTAAAPPKLSTFPCLHRKSPVRITSAAAARSRIPKKTPAARDRVIDFGKYKGKMLGSLPSSYLRWVSKNLRAGDTEEWAKLADEVLSDPVYRDRIEWEFAEKILSGDAASGSSGGRGGGAVAELLEISERFGWDNEDRGGWSRVDFGLLGTSKGGRIPRLAAAAAESGGAGNLRKKEKIEVEEISEEDDERRRERRERARLRRVVISGEEREGDGGDNCGARHPDPVVGRSPFPGRESLLRKVLNRQRIL